MVIYTTDQKIAGGTLPSGDGVLYFVYKLNAGKVVWDGLLKVKGWGFFKGLMGQVGVKRGLVFDFGKMGRLVNSIHSLFCPEFEAVFFDEDFRVVDFQVVKPWQFVVLSKKPFRYLLELPVGSFRAAGVSVGEELVLDWRYG